MRFKLDIFNDGVVRWHGVDTGVTTVIAHNPKRKIIALKTAGHTTWDGAGKLYDAAHYTVYEYELLGEFEKGNRFGITSSGIVIEIDELFGALRWNVRGAK